jgi:hypothetical protein
MEEDSDPLKGRTGDIIPVEVGDDAPQGPDPHWTEDAVAELIVTDVP